MVAVNLDSGKVCLLAERKTLPDADAIVKMAVMRRGVEEEFFRRSAQRGIVSRRRQWDRQESLAALLR
jgi:hypothetical protein